MTAMSKIDENSGAVFYAELEFRKESRCLTPAEAIFGTYIGSGVGAVSGARINGTTRWDLFEHRRGQTCDANLRGVIETNDGAAISFEVLRLFRRTGGGDAWILAAGARFATEDSRSDG